MQIMPYNILNYKRKNYYLTQTLYCVIRYRYMHTNTPPQKELMNIETFLEVYSLSRSKFYSEVKKHPWLITKLGNRTYIKRTDAQEWLNNIGLGAPN